MMLESVFERFVSGSPVTTMAQLGLEWVLEPSWLDKVFEEYRGRQYERDPSRAQETRQEETRPSQGRWRPRLNRSTTQEGSP